VVVVVSSWSLRIFRTLGVLALKSLGAPGVLAADKKKEPESKGARE